MKRKRKSQKTRDWCVRNYVECIISVHPCNCEEQRFEQSQIEFSMKVTIRSRRSEYLEKN